MLFREEEFKFWSKIVIFLPMSIISGLNTVEFISVVDFKEEMAKNGLYSLVKRSSLSK